MTWDTSTPLGSSNVREGDNVLRELWADMETALQSHGRFPIDANDPKYVYFGGKGTTAERTAISNGDGGLFFDTDTSELYRDNDSTWDVVGSSWPTLTKAIFYQDTAPLGWTIIDTITDHFIHILSTSGGATAGQYNGTSESDGAHIHNWGKTHFLSSQVGFQLYHTNYGSPSYEMDLYNYPFYLAAGSGYMGVGASGSSGVISHNEDGVTSSSGAHTHTVSHDSGDHEWLSVIVATKD